MDNFAVPEALASLLTAAVARELAESYGDQVVFPDRVEIAQPDHVDRLFPGWPAPVLVIAHENQGVCSWGLPLGDPDPPVLVGGQLTDGSNWSAQTLVYSQIPAAYVAVRRWDRACLRGEPLLQAQAAELDTATLAVLRDRFREVFPTRGWPARQQYRFEGPDIKIMLWSGQGQCDWWLSAADAATLEPVTRDLLALSDLRSSLWSHNSIGTALLGAIRSI
jgi:hypothetical protein